MTAATSFACSRGSCGTEAVSGDEADDPPVTTAVVAVMSTAVRRRHEASRASPQLADPRSTRTSKPSGGSFSGTSCNRRSVGPGERLELARAVGTVGGVGDQVGAGVVRRWSRGASSTRSSAKASCGRDGVRSRQVTRLDQRVAELGKGASDAGLRRPERICSASATSAAVYP